MFKIAQIAGKFKMEIWRVANNCLHLLFRRAKLCYMGFRIINGDKIRERRGNRSLREIAAAANGAFTYSALYQWEKDGIRPVDENVPILLDILGCKYEDISDPVGVVKK